ncbi:MAG TPA: alpha/beta fold hydrolase [Chthonomonadaceae bacterium]|nr:alpha/beta fold hydrolase [Chthonomonadaceae bacterium]
MIARRSEVCASRSAGRAVRGASPAGSDRGRPPGLALTAGRAGTSRRSALLGLAGAVLAFALPGCNGSSSDANSLVGSPAGAKEVHFKTADGWDIFGDIYLPTGASKGAVILLHQRDGAASDWKALAAALRIAGYTALAIDQRGAGRSVQGPGGVGGKGDNAPWETGPDIEAAIQYLSGKGPVALVGASYGANNALIYAAAHPNQVKSLVLFSPGADYHGLDAISAAKKWSGPIEIFHDKGDTIAGDGPAAIDKATPSTDHTLVLTSGSRHGVGLLRDALTNANASPVAFLQRTLK